MCGIAGGADVEAIVERLRHRGGSVHVSDGMGHVLHAVVGDVAQPLERDGRLVANCEIYDWEKLADEHGIDAANDADLLLALLDRHGADALDMVSGVYAVAYERGGELLLARDRLGVRPLFYTTEPFRFASERQALESHGDVWELHPRHLIRVRDGDVTQEYRGMPWDADERDVDIETAAAETAERLRAAVAKRVPDEPVALLFSGGLDSTVLAAALQDAGAEFTAYTAGIQHGNVDAPRDVGWAEDVADAMGFDQVTAEADLDGVEEAVPDLVAQLSTANPVKIGVALPFHVALAAADERVAMSGLGAEQLYAGYSRQIRDPNDEARWGLLGLHHRDLYRDDVVAMRNGTELRLPLLDDDLVEHALSIPGEHKVDGETRKVVLRRAAERLGVPEDVAWRDKRAAQYGSNFDKALDRLARDSGASKQDYLRQFRDDPEHRLAALFSGGKDSNAALHRMRRRNADIGCLVNLQSRNPDSYMFDAKEKEIVEEQAAALDIPLLVEETAGAKEDELADLERALERARDEFRVDGVVAGAVASSYQRDRLERVADRVGLKTFSPLWGTDPAGYLRWLVREGFAVEITEVKARGLDESWVGRVLDGERAEELIALADEHGFHPAGEGGGFETVVVDGPGFADRVDVASS